MEGARGTFALGVVLGTKGDEAHHHGVLRILRKLPQARGVARRTGSGRDRVGGQARQRESLPFDVTGEVPVADVTAEVHSLVERGAKEIVLLGQNVNAYRGTLHNGDGEADFAYLLEAIHRIEAIGRIRYTTSHPREFSRRLIEGWGGTIGVASAPGAGTTMTISLVAAPPA